MPWFSWLPHRGPCKTLKSASQHGLPSVIPRAVINRKFLNWILLTGHGKEEDDGGAWSFCDRDLLGHHHSCSLRSKLPIRQISKSQLKYSPETLGYGCYFCMIDSRQKHIFSLLVIGLFLVPEVCPALLRGMHTSRDLSRCSSGPEAGGAIFTFSLCLTPDHQCLWKRPISLSV